MNKYYLIALIPLVLLSGCLNDDKKSDKDNSSLLDGHNKVIDKAKNVEDVLQRSFDSRKQGE